jgi:hypothetical protein
MIRDENMVLFIYLSCIPLFTGIYVHEIPGIVPAQISLVCSLTRLKRHPFMQQLAYIVRYAVPVNPQCYP